MTLQSTLRDLMPTLLGLAGVPVPDGVDGKDLRAASHGLHWIRSERHKYLWFSGDGHEQLFDLGSDPREEHDLAGDPSAAAELARHRALLVAELEGREECLVADGELVPGRPLQSEASWVREIRLSSEQVATSG